MHHKTFEKFGIYPGRCLWVTILCHCSRHAIPLALPNMASVSRSRQWHSKCSRCFVAWHSGTVEMGSHTDPEVHEVTSRVAPLDMRCHSGPAGPHGASRRRHTQKRRQYWWEDWWCAPPACCIAAGCSPLSTCTLMPLACALDGLQV